MKTKLLCLFADYKNSSIELSGVNVDKLNIIEMCKINGFDYFFLENKQLTKANIEKFINITEPDIIWFSGHGILDSKGANCFILPSYTSTMTLTNDNNLKDYELAHVIEKWSIKCRNKCLIICDMCHSGTMVNLKYYYRNYEFSEKINDAEYEPQLKSACGQDRYIISVAGATDFNTTTESSEFGGFLTNEIVKLFLNKSNFNLIELYSVKFNIKTEDSDFILSTSFIVNPYEHVLE